MFDDPSQDVFIRLQLFQVADVDQEIHEVPGRHLLEFDVDGAPVSQRRQKLVRFRRAEDVVVVLRHILDILQKQLGLVLGQTVAFVDEKDTATAAIKDCPTALRVEVLENFPEVILHFFNRIQLNHRHAAFPGDDPPATKTFAAGLARGPLFAVETHLDDPRHGCLAGAAQPVKEEAVRDSFLPEGVRDDPSRLVVSGHFADSAGPVDLREVAITPSNHQAALAGPDDLLPEVCDDFSSVLFHAVLHLRREDSIRASEPHTVPREVEVPRPAL